jgi:hypothetical protein
VDGGHISSEQQQQQQMYADKAAIEYILGLPRGFKYSQVLLLSNWSSGSRVLLLVLLSCLPLGRHRT